MIEKIDVKDASIAEEIRKNMGVATSARNGLMEAGSVRYVKTRGLNINENQACIKLYSSVGRASVSAIVCTGRIEGSTASSFVLSFAAATSGTFYCNIKRISGNNPAKFYYHKNGGNASIYLVTGVDYSITNVVPLIETGSYSYHLTRDTLPDGAVEIIPE